MGEHLVDCDVWKSGLPSKYIVVGDIRTAREGSYGIGLVRATTGSTIGIGGVRFELTYEGYNKIARVCNLQRRMGYDIWEWQQSQDAKN